MTSGIFAKIGGILLGCAPLWIGKQNHMSGNNTTLLEPSPWVLATKHGLLLSISPYGVGPTGRAKPRWKVSVYRDPFLPGAYVYAFGFAEAPGLEALMAACVADAIGQQASVGLPVVAGGTAEDLGLF